MNQALLDVFTIGRGLKLEGVKVEQIGDFANGEQFAHMHIISPSMQCFFRGGENEGVDYFYFILYQTKHFYYELHFIKLKFFIKNKQNTSIMSMHFIGMIQDKGEI